MKRQYYCEAWLLASHMSALFNNEFDGLEEFEIKAIENFLNRVTRLELITKEVDGLDVWQCALTTDKLTNQYGPCYKCSYITK